jgi:hypothetical protein
MRKSLNRCLQPEQIRYATIIDYCFCFLSYTKYLRFRGWDNQQFVCITFHIHCAFVCLDVIRQGKVSYENPKSGSYLEDRRLSHDWRFTARTKGY